jgi:hypothetical protein
MDKFLDQFDIPGMLRVRFEQFIFRQADQMVEGYCGGNWESRDIGGVRILLIPSADTSKQEHLTNQVFGGGVRTDHLTASAAFTSVVTNWFWHMVAEKGVIGEKEHNKFMAFHEGMKDAVYKKGSGINQRDYFEFTD